MNEKQYRPEIAPQIRHADELEISRGMHAGPVGRVGAIMLVALIFMAVFNSEGLLNWSLKLPTGVVGDTVISGCGAWHDWMDALGATEVRNHLRDGFRYFQSL